MKLLLRRNQKYGTFSSKITFTLDVRAEITEAEKAAIKKYKLEDEVLYSRDKFPQMDGSVVKNYGKFLMFKMTNLSLHVKDLAEGKTIDCKDILEMQAIEEQVKTAAQNLKGILETATNFVGEEVIEI